MKKMLRLIPLWLFCILALSSSAAYARTVRLFVIGNSFSKNATQYLPQLAAEGGHELVIGRAELGGCTLERHWRHAAAAQANVDDAEGKPYGGKSLKMLMDQNTWDVVTIQQASVFSGDPAAYRPYAQNIYDYVKSLQPQAEVVFHQTWAYRSDAKNFTRIDGEKRAQSQQEMWENSRAAYHAVAKELGIRIIPNGDAFWNVSADPKWCYQKDANFDFVKPVAPALPSQEYSLHVGYSWGKDKFRFDPNHANAAGCYLGALVWYGFLFDESPEKLTFVPPNVSSEFAAHLRKVAWETVQQNRAVINAK